MTTAGHDGTSMKSRLRADLVAAMKGGRKQEVSLLRELVALIDNAEAAPSRDEQASVVRHEFGSRSAETERLQLSADRVRDLLLADLERREQAASEFARLGNNQAAATLRAEASLARRYLEE